MNRWYQETKREHYHKEAKRFGYRARSAFKLKQIHKKFNIFSEGDIVIDFGAAPGGWSQVALEFVGKKGIIIGVDKLSIKNIENVQFIEGDITDNETLLEIKKLLNNDLADVVLSDISPDISGNYSVDHARSIWLCTQALELAVQLLRPSGIFVCKTFEGSDTIEFIKKTKKHFVIVKKYSPDASRKRSSEIYIIAKSLKNISS